MNKLVLTLILYFISNVALALDASVKVEPFEPLVNEAFNLNFTIELTGDEEPQISFTPDHAEVIDKVNRGVSVSTSIINGRYSSRKAMSVSYELITDRPGILTISNIKITAGSETKKIPNLRMNILKKRRSPKEIFAAAEVSNENPYKGEGVDVRYYVYTRVPVVGQEIKVFPKLNKFVKRFHIIRDVSETVRYNNLVYRRSLIYSARVYPNKVGKASIDPIKVLVQYQGTATRNSYGGFGLALRSVKNKTLISEKININVKPLPAENVPSSFTGLVGKHNFSLKGSRNKFLINEAIEIKLEVTGEGLLESFEGPVLYKHDNLEQFDTKSELIEIDRQRSKKSFDYTYLARGPVDYNNKKITLSYFNTDTKEYVENELSLPDVFVEGSNVSTPSSNSTRIYQKEKKQEKNIINVDDKELKIVGPVFSTKKDVKSYFYSIKTFNNVLILFIMLLFAGPLIRRLKSKKKSDFDLLTEKLKKNKVTYSVVHRVLVSKLGGTSGQNTTELIKVSQLSDGAKSYFGSLVEEAQKATYKNGKKLKIKYNSKFMKELSRIDEIS